MGYEVVLWNLNREANVANLIYSAICSLDGYIEDKEGKFDWAMPDAEVHGFVNDLERSAGTYLFGRRMYQTMMVWETDPSIAKLSPQTHDYAEIWLAANKIVYSKTLEKVSTTKTKLEREFNPDDIQRLKKTADGDILIGGPNLAAHAFRAGLIDDCQFFLTPVVVGGGKKAFPEDVKINLELLEERKFKSGMVYLRYQIKR